MTEPDTDCMRNRDKWKPSKYVYQNGRLIGSRNRGEVGVGSRLIVDLVASVYDTNLRSHARGRLLDLGCGNVPLLSTYEHFVQEITCVDWEHTLHKNEYLDYRCDLTKRLPFADGEFDTIILSDVLEHLPQPEHLWSEMSRVVAERGRIIVNVPFYYWIHEPPYDYYRYTEFALRRFVEMSGLRLIQLDSIGGAPEIVADIVAKNIASVPVIGELLAMFVQWLTLSFTGTKYGKKLSQATSAAFPFAYFLVAEKPAAISID